jgi:RHS repeat-associated protein
MRVASHRDFAQLCLRSLVLVTLVACICAAPANAALPEIEAQHMPEIVEWVYRNGALKSPVGCGAVCSALWAVEEREPVGEKGLWDQLGELETTETNLWGSLSEVPNHMGQRSLGELPLQVGWTMSSSYAQKWMALNGPVAPNVTPPVCPTGGWSTKFHVKGESIGGTFFETATSPGSDWFLLDCGNSEIINQYTSNESSPCTLSAKIPASWEQVVWWWNECFEGYNEKGEEIRSKTFAHAYYQNFHFGRPEDYVGQTLENQFGTPEGSDPGSAFVREKTEKYLEGAAVLSAWLQSTLVLATTGAAELYGRKASGCFAGKPVNCVTGNEVETQTDLAVGGRGPGLSVTRTYNAQAAALATTHGAFGYGWSGPYTARLELSGAGDATVYQDDGSTVRFIASKGEWVPIADPLPQTTLKSEGGSYIFTLPNQTKLTFNSSGLLTSETDRNGNAVTMGRNAEGRLESATDAASRKLTFAYNAEGLVESVKDPMGHTVKYAYEGGKLKSVVEPGEVSPRWQFGYDTHNRLTSETDGRGHITKIEYDTSNRVIKETDPLERNRTWKYTTTTSGLETEIAEPTGAVTLEKFNFAYLPTSVTHGSGTASAVTTTYEYDSQYNEIAATDPNKHTTKYEYNAKGDRTGETDPAGDITRWEYNGTHDVIAVTTARGETTKIKRDAHGNAEQIERPTPGGTQTAKFKYDAHGELESSTDPLNRTTKYEYDTAGDRTAEVDPAGDKRTWTYDEDSREATSVSPRGNVTGGEPSKFTAKIERDAQGRPLTVTDQLGHTTKTTYDANGDVETVTDANSHVTTNTYDSDGELTKVKRPTGATAETGYDAAGQVTSQTDGNKHTTKYVRNVLEQVKETLDPLNRKTTEEYDAAGSVATETDPAKHTTTYTYDAANRLTEAKYSDGKTATVKYEYNPDGLRTSMTDGTGTTAYTYDQLDRLFQTKDGHGNITTFEHDLGNQLVAIKYPGEKTVTQLYDSAGRLESITDWLEHTTKFGYDADSNLITTTLPANVDKATYSNDDALTKTEVKKGAEVLASITYTRDNAKQIKTATNKSLPGEEKPTYTYDANSRLTKVGTGAYEYDAADSATKTLGSTNKYDVASEIEKSTGASYGYDELGERTKRTPTSGPATTYSYDQARNLIGVTRPHEGEVAAIEDSYAYNGDGLRMSQTISGSTTYLAWETASQLPLLLNDGQNSYIYGPNGQAMEQINGEGVPTYLHADQQGSTRVLTSATGAVVGTVTYDAYGNPTGSTGTAKTPLGYDGQYTSSDTGLIYLRARVYDPSTAQFMTGDPLAAVTRAPYNYVGDNPLNYSDPTGLIFGIPGTPSWEEVGEGVAGWGDTLTLGATKWAREQLGDENVNTCSGAYRVGGYGGLATGLLIPGEGEARLGAEAAAEEATGVAGWGTLLNDVVEATGHHYFFIGTSGLAVVAGLGGVGYLIYEKVK